MTDETTRLRDALRWNACVEVRVLAWRADEPADMQAGEDDDYCMASTRRDGVWNEKGVEAPPLCCWRPPDHTGRHHDPFQKVDWELDANDAFPPAAEARAGLVSVEAVREAAHWLERSQREQNVHQFRHGMALLRAALAGPTPSPAVERLDVQEVLDVLGAHEGNGCCDPKTLEHVAQDIHGLADAADILAVRAETLAGPGVVETPETAFEALRPRTRAGWALLGREALNSRSFALINAADIVAIEQEALALAATPPAPAVERVVGAVFCPCLPSGGWVCEECGAPVESEPCPDHMDPEGVMTYRPGVPCPDRRTPTPEPTDG